MMDPKQIQQVKIAVRKIWSWSRQRREALKRAKVDEFHDMCAICQKPTERVTIDHLNAVGMSYDWNSFFELMFCEPEHLQAICRACHRKKTSQDKKNMRATKKKIQKP